MGSAANNLFLRLNKWATRQDENFLTESLAVVLMHLLDKAPVAGKRIVAELTDQFIGLPTDDAGTIKIVTQVEEENGRLDLQIRTQDRRVWVEVKVESGLGDGQLERYSGMLRTKSDEENRLILLSRYPVDTAFADPELRKFRWFQAADWFRGESCAIQTADAVAGFLTQQFVNFLEARGMTIERVEKYLPEGVRALSNLTNMLFAAAMACKVSVKKRSPKDCIGLNLDGLKYWVGVSLSDPEKLWFGTRCRIDSEYAAKLSQAIPPERLWSATNCRWWRGAELDSESVHFFSRTKDSQLRWVEDFLQECLRMAHSIEMPNQPPIPEEPEES